MTFCITSALESEDALEPSDTARHHIVRMSSVLLFVVYTNERKLIYLNLLCDVPSSSGICLKATSL